MTDFRHYTTFHHVIFNGSADFRRSTFSDYADFYASVFNAPPDFYSSTSYDSFDFSDTTFNFSYDIRGPQEFKQIMTNNEKVCNFFREYYQSEARYNDADNIYYNYRELAQESKSLISFSKWTDILSWIACGYGVRPLRMFYCGGIIVGVFAFLYWREQGIYRSSDAEENKPKISGLDALLFSIREFTTLGSADWYPKDNFRVLVTLEGLFGYIMLGIFMATLTAVMIRF